MNIVAIAAPDQPFLHPMVIRLTEIGFGRRVAAIAEIRLGPHQQVLGFVRVMRRVAVQASDAATSVYRGRKVPLLVLVTMAT
jgi:hypothetical protein